MNSTSIALALLAAGRGARFGPSGKLHHIMPTGHSLLAESARLYAKACVHHRLMIIRSNDQAAAHAAEQLGYSAIVNHAATNGMASSVKTAVQAASHMGSTWLMIALADMPYVHPDSITVLCQYGNGPHKIIQPQYKQRHGHPVLWHKSLFQKLMTISGDTGGREIIHQHQDQRLSVMVDDPGIHMDIDRKSDISMNT